jgi:uncharacterized membrane protein YqaE (UPF0057 family)
MSDINENKLLLCIIALILPPLAVYLKEGFGTNFIINLILALLLIPYLIAIIHAVFVVLK